MRETRIRHCFHCNTLQRQAQSLLERHAQVITGTVDMALCGDPSISSTNIRLVGQLAFVAQFLEPHLKGLNGIAYGYRNGHGNMTLCSNAHGQSPHEEAAIIHSRPLPPIVPNPSTRYCQSQTTGSRRSHVDSYNRSVWPKLFRIVEKREHFWTNGFT